MVWTCIKGLPARIHYCLMEGKKARMEKTEKIWMENTTRGLTNMENSPPQGQRQNATKVFCPIFIINKLKEEREREISMKASKRKTEKTLFKTYLTERRRQRESLIHSLSSNQINSTDVTFHRKCPLLNPGSNGSNRFNWEIYSKFRQSL